MKQVIRSLLILTVVSGFLLGLAPLRIAQAAFAGYNGRIAYTYYDAFDERAILMDMAYDGTDQRVVNDTHSLMGARYSPNGNQLVAVGSHENEEDIYVVDSDGGNLINLTAGVFTSGEFENLEIDFGVPSFSPDGGTIIFNVVKYDNSEYTSTSSIYTMSNTGSNLQRITDDVNEVCDSSVVFSPDGNKVAFTRWDGSVGDLGLFTMNPDGSGQVKVRDIVSGVGSYSCRESGAGGYIDNLFSVSDGYQTVIDWSPDGQRLVYGMMSHVYNGSEETVIRRIMTTSLTGQTSIIHEVVRSYDNSQLDLGPDHQPEPRTSDILTQPQYTPDGKIIYVAGNFTTAFQYDGDGWQEDVSSASLERSVQVVDSDGSSLKTVVSGVASGDDMQSVLALLYSFLTPTVQPLSAPFNPKPPQDLDPQSPEGSPNRVTLANSVTNESIQLTTPEDTDITCSSSIKEGSLSSKDSDYQYPLGLVDFCFDTELEDNQVNLVFVTDLAPSQVAARKYNPISKTYFDIEDAVITQTAYQSQPAISLTYTITDNGSLDIDPATGSIKDPVGLAVLADSTDQPADSLVNTGTAITILVSLVSPTIVFLAMRVLRQTNVTRPYRR